MISIAAVSRFAAQHAADDLERFVEPRQALADRREVEAVPLVLGLETARADPDRLDPDRIRAQRQGDADGILTPRLGCPLRDPSQSA